MSVYKHGNWWYYDFKLYGRRHRGRGGTTKTEAKRAEAKVKSEALSGLQNISTMKTKYISIEDFAKKYLESRKHLRSQKRDELSVRTLLAFFSNNLLQEIDPELIDRYKSKRVNDGVANATINRELAALKKMFNIAITWRKYGITYNPVKDVDFLKEPPGRTRYLSLSEIPEFLISCDDYFRPIVLTALHTGMRLKEILDLKWENIYIRNVLSPYLEVAMSKNNEKRIIPLDETMINLFKELPKKLEYVFLNMRGNAKLNRVTKPFENALKKAGIDNFRFHDLRHTFASHFVMSGGDLLSLKEILGHSDIRMAQRYSHLRPEYKKEKLNNLDKVFSESTHKSPTTGKIGEIRKVVND